ncbi:MAG TPA: L-aspartate oxidase, partial [Thermodesulfovibrionales bacterium]|nr:L-aspartate oxidase [Thermodesulfovibrionales bacterium]
SPSSGYPRLFDLEEIRHSLKKLMWERVGIIRCEDSLSEAKQKLESWEFVLNKRFVTRRELELKNMFTLASLITESALLRKGSAGAHYRSDFRVKEPDWKKHITSVSDERGVNHEFVA